jgi:hypothetical protein
MMRWMGVFAASCLALPVLLAHEPDINELGKDIVRSLNAAADELEAMFKERPDKKVIEEKISKIDNELRELLGKYGKLSKENQKALNEKFHNELKTADDRYKAARAKFDDVVPPRENLEEIKKRILENSEKIVERSKPEEVEKRVKLKDPAETLKLHDQKIKDLKKLLEQDNPDGGQNDPMNNNPKGNDPKGNDPKGNDPKGNDPKGNDPKGKDPKGNDPKDKNPKGSDPKGNDPKSNDPKEKNPNIGKDPKGKPDEKKIAGQLNDRPKKIEEWGKLQGKEREAMETFARERFMQRYYDDLIQYYLDIDEASRKRD